MEKTHYKLLWFVTPPSSFSPSPEMLPPVHMQPPRMLCSTTSIKSKSEIHVLGVLETTCMSTNFYILSPSTTPTSTQAACPEITNTKWAFITAVETRMLLCLIFCQGHLDDPLGVMEKSNWWHHDPLISEARETPVRHLQGHPLPSAIGLQPFSWQII